MPDELRQRQPRQHDPDYLAWLRTQPCCLCGRTPADAAHLRVGSINHDKRDTGMGERSSDFWALPLCRDHHQQQHSMNELEFWASYGIDPFALAMRYRRDDD
jgi:hypothetical protein